MNHTQSYYHRIATLSQIFLYNIHSDICPISKSLQTFGAEFCTCDYFCRFLLLMNDNSFDNNSYPSSLTIYHSSILPTLTMILLSAHFLLSLHLWSFRLPETSVQILIHCKISSGHWWFLLQFTILPISTHNSLAFNQTSHSLSHSPISHTIHIDHPTTTTLQQGHW